MLANTFDDRAGTNPLADGTVRVIVVDRSSGWIGTVESVAGSPVGGFGDGLVKLAVRDGGKCPRLVDYAGECVRKRRVLHAVEDNRTYRNLSGIGFAPGLGGNNPSQKIDIGLRSLRLGAYADTQPLQSLWAGDAVDSQALLLLKLFNGGLGLGTVDTIDASGIKAAFLQGLLNSLDFSSSGTHFGEGVNSRGGEDRAEDRNYHGVKKDDNSSLADQAYLFFHLWTILSCKLDIPRRQNPVANSFSEFLQKM